MLIQVLTPGFTSPNGRAFLFPFLVWKAQLRHAGIEVRLVGSLDALRDSDVIVVDSKFHRDLWETDIERIYADFATCRARTQCLIYSDTTDSSGWLQTELLPVVDRYWKFQLLKDRSQYLRPMYGHRIYADYYHQTKGVIDATPEWSSAVQDPALLEKVAVSWNSGLADYSLYGPYRMAAYMRLPLSGLLRFPSGAFVAPARRRKTPVSCRFGVSYPRESVAWQRKAIRTLLKDRLPTNKLSRRDYFAELADSQVIVSPFGFGEITLKDFEVFLTGGVLIKPDMSHLETWPNLFRGGETMLTHSWDLQDLPEVIDAALANYGDMRLIAEAGQDVYRRHIGVEGASLFVAHLHSLVTIG